MLRFKHLIFNFLLTLSFSSSMVFAETVNLSEYESKLDNFISTVNETKLILDAPESSANMQVQRYALCQRIEAYQNILNLVNQFPHAENSHLMKVIAEDFLTRQVSSFQKTGVSEENFCVLNQE